MTPKTDRPPLPSDAAVAEGAAPSADVLLRPTRVLIVDDSAAQRRLVRIALEYDPAFEVEGEAAEGGSAVRTARALQPDLVVLDLAMPGMDGFEAIPRILEAAPHARIVVFSGQSEAATQDRVRALGAVDLVSKGLAPPEVVARLRAAMDSA